MADIAATLRLEQKALYRREKKLLGKLREGLEAEGIDAAAVQDILESPAITLDWARTTPGKEITMNRPSMAAAPRPSRTREGTGATGGAERAPRSGRHDAVGGARACRRVSRRRTARRVRRGVLDAAAREAIEAHLITCADCRFAIVETMAFLGAKPPRWRPRRQRRFTADTACRGAAGRPLPVPRPQPYAAATGVRSHGAAGRRRRRVFRFSTDGPARVVPFRTRPWVTG